MVLSRFMGVIVAVILNVSYSVENVTWVNNNG